MTPAVAQLARSGGRYPRYDVPEVRKTRISPSCHPAAGRQTPADSMSPPRVGPRSTEGVTKQLAQRGNPLSRPALARCSVGRASKRLVSIATIRPRG
jgi:hypothetical protein